MSWHLFIVLNIQWIPSWPSNTLDGVFKARILKWFAVPFSSGPRFVRTLHHDPSIFGGSATAWLSFIELDKAVVHMIRPRHHFANKGPSSQVYGFSSSHVWMWELDYKESWELKNWCFWTVVLEKTLESPLDCKEIQPIHPKGDQSWIFIGRTDVEAETPVPWPPDAKSWLTGKDPDPGKDWRQEEKGTTGNEMVRWHHRLNGHEFG